MEWIYSGIAKAWNVMAFVYSDQITGGAIIKFISGDTFVLADVASGTTKKIKLNRTMAPVKGQRGFKKSRNFARSVLTRDGQPLKLKVAIKAVQDGYYIAEIKYPTFTKRGRVEWKDYQATAVSRGMVFVTDPHADIALTALQTGAKNNKLGCWDTDNFVYPWNYNLEKKEYKMALKMLRG
jgi:endonuclease YncB( thermonuclease family)